MTRSDVIDSAIRTFRPKTPIQVETSFLISSHRPVNGYDNPFKAFRLTLGFAK